MKPLFHLSFLLLLTVCFTASGQNILLVDNSAGAPTGAHVFNDLQSAIDATVAGDVIHVRPSASTYGDVNISTTNDSISIFGIGFNPDKDNPLRSVVGQISLDGSNVRISGLVFTIQLDIATGNAGTPAYSNILVDNCQMPRITMGDGSDEVANVIIRNCIITGGTSNIPYISSASTSSQIIVTNNIITGYNGTSTSSIEGSVACDNGCIYRNNIFFNDGGVSKFAFEDFTNSTASNNIFFGVSPQSSGGSITNSSFKNNMATASTDDNFVPAANGNSLTANLASIAQGSVFTDTNIVPDLNWDLSWVPDLQTSPLQLGGTDGTDVGPTGSSIPFSVTGTPLPYIRVLDATELIKQGETLNISIDAIGN